MVVRERVWLSVEAKVSPFLHLIVKMLIGSNLVTCTDSRVYIWRRHSGLQVAALDAHPGTVNAVAWHPHHPGIFASAGDDRKVRM